MSVRVASHQQICLNQLQLTCKHICSYVAESNIYICYTCLRPACMSLCPYPTNGLVSKIVPDHQACIYSCTRLAVMSLLVAYYQHGCLLQFHLISIHVYYICTRLSAMSVKIPSDHIPFLNQLHLTSSHICKLKHTTMHV